LIRSVFGFADFSCKLIVSINPPKQRSEADPGDRRETENLNGFYRIDLCLTASDLPTLAPNNTKLRQFVQCLS
jgi:hypothetical protein